MKKELSGIVLQCVQGDITTQSDVDCVVNAANAELMPVGGVAGAIHRAAGSKLQTECRALAPIKPGEAVITKAYDLPNRYVIHCLGPVYGIDKPSEQLLANCYENALKLAEENHISSIAFPAISTGAFGFPIKPAAEVAFSTITSKLPNLKSLKKIRFVLFSNRDYQIHRQVLEEMS